MKQWLWSKHSHTLPVNNTVNNTGLLADRYGAGCKTSELKTLVMYSRYVYHPGPFPEVWAVWDTCLYISFLIKGPYSFIYRLIALCQSQWHKLKDTIYCRDSIRCKEYDIFINYVQCTNNKLTTIFSRCIDVFIVILPYCFAFRISKTNQLRFTHLNRSATITSDTIWDLLPSLVKQSEICYQPH